MAIETDVILFAQPDIVTTTVVVQLIHKPENQMEQHNVMVGLFFATSPC